MIKISVIIPVYNVEQYLRQMLDSICGQTLKEIEIICVNDGSSDGSLQILHEYAEKDHRMAVLSQENSGAGTARNVGMKIARGKYLSILDSDDFFEPGMLEKAYRQCEEGQAELCVFRSDRYDTQTGQHELIPWTVKEEYLPGKDPFTPKDIYPYAFQVFNGWSWDKLYRRDAVLKSGLQFQELRTTNDAFFVFLMNLQVKKITVLEEVLAHHRVNVKTSLSVTREKSWDCCWQAAAAIQKELKRRGQYGAVEQSFINWALQFLLWNVHSLKQAEARKGLLREMREHYFRQLGLEQYPPEYFYNKDEYQEYVNISQPDSMGKRLRQLYIKIKRKFMNRLKR